MMVYLVLVYRVIVMAIRFSLLRTLLLLMTGLIIIKPQH
nr:MAG TPA: hypothetical protein [Caudoviricetes sp.]DAV73357.1 MAG TPA: hypothetical protein [Bacteriophage sp.]